MPTGMHTVFWQCLPQREQTKYCQQSSDIESDSLIYLVIFLYSMAHERVASPSGKKPDSCFSNIKSSHVITVAPRAAGMPGD